MKKSRYLLLALLAVLLLIAACSSNKSKKPVVVPPTNMELAVAYGDSASTAFEDENYDLALTGFVKSRDYYQQAATTAAVTDSIDVRIERVQLNIALTYMKMAADDAQMSMYDIALTEYEGAVGVYKSLAPLTITAEERDEFVKILYQNLASTAELAGQYERALTYYDNVLDYLPGNSDVLNRKYFILKDNIKDTNRAIQVLKDYADASQNSNAYQVLAKAYKDRGDNASAGTYYDRALELSPTPEVYTRVADFYRETGNFQKSNATLERFIATSPGNEYLSLAYRVMAGNYDKLNNTAKKIEFFEKAQGVERNVDVALLLANHYNGTKNWDKVITFATQAISLDATKAVAYLLRGNAYYQKKNNTAARADLQRIQNDATYGKSASDLLKRIK